MSPETLPPHLTGDLGVLMIDNFDSFTWNLYQQLCLNGAEVTVIRNDAIPASLLPQLKIKSLIISPGPGHPKTDSGISKAAIEYFQGKVPILGVCMGLECLVDLYGGEIKYAGEIMHGKVSPIRHDDRGCFRGLPQGIKSIRYHSLSAAHSTLPPELAITSATEESGVIMGVRHRKYTVEAVQYHPESILSEGGDELVRNFLSLRGGFWEENPQAKVLDSALPAFPYEALAAEVVNKPGAKAKIPSILDRIYAQRLEDVSKAEATPGTTLADIQTLLSLNIAPPLISVMPRVKPSGQPSLFAEIKRASPSKGPISVTTSPAKQALTYALAGAHLISVLTEPKWFLGSLQDMLHARMSVAHLPNRPAILRKDFILSRYQVLESRLWGADTILLIVSMLPEPLLRDLYAFSLEVGMEPLVEVNNAKEMEIALSLPAKLIGVNNRNLHDFKVDMNTTSRLSDMVKGKDVILAALSGITGAEDVQRYASEGVGAVLVGESLMRAKDTAAFVRELLSIPQAPSTPPAWRSYPPLVKICGIRTSDEALAVAAAGADMLGLVFVSSSKRAIDVPTAKQISHAIRTARYSSATASAADDVRTAANAPWLTAHATRLSKAASTGARPLLVGVFQDAPLAEILRVTAEVQLDVVQLHGAEPTEWAQQIPVPVIRVFHVGKSGRGLDGITRGGAHQFVLLDSVREDGSGVSGGSGKVVDLNIARRVVEAGEILVPSAGSTGDVVPDAAASTSAPSETVLFPLPIILAGGLTTNNVSAAISHVRPWAVDVSGGVENATGSGKDITKVEEFIKNAKYIPVSEWEESDGSEEDGTDEDSGSSKEELNQ